MNWFGRANQLGIPKEEAERLAAASQPRRATSRASQIPPLIRDGCRRGGANHTASASWRRRGRTQRAIMPMGGPQTAVGSARARGCHGTNDRGRHGGEGMGVGDGDGIRRRHGEIPYVSCRAGSWASGTPYASYTGGGQAVGGGLVETQACVTPRPVKIPTKRTLGFSAIHWLAGSVSDKRDLRAYVCGRYFTFASRVSTINSCLKQGRLTGCGTGSPLKKVPESARVKPNIRTPSCGDWRVLRALTSPRNP